MASSLRLLCALLLLLCSIHGGRGQPCRTSDISVEQRKTRATVEGQAEYEVTVSNTCDCPQSKVMMLCYGLSSVEAVDPRAIKPVDAKLYAVAEGRPLSKGTPVKFKHAWKTPKDFPVVSTEIRCFFLCFVTMSWMSNVLKSNKKDSGECNVVFHKTPNSFYYDHF